MSLAEIRPLFRTPARHRGEDRGQLSLPLFSDEARATTLTTSAPCPVSRASLERFAIILTEVLYAERPAQQILRWTTPSVYSQLADRPVPRLIRRKGVRVRPKAKVHSVRSWSYRSDAVELSLHLMTEERSHAVAVQLQFIDGRWQCSALQFDPSIAA